MIIGLALAWAVIFVGCWLGWQLLRQSGRMLLRLDELEKRLDEVEYGGAEEPTGLPIGTDAPAFALADLGGDHKEVAQFRGQPLLLVFFNPACGFCRDMMPKLATLQKTETRRHDLETGSSIAGNGSSKAHPRILIVSGGSAEENRKLFDAHRVAYPVLLQKEMEVAAAYRANGTPSGYLISAEGKIASELAMGAEALLGLAAGKPEVRSAKSELEQNPDSAAGNGDGRESRVRSLARSKIKRDGLKAGTAAPDFRLPRLDGRGELSLSDLRGRQVLLVFSSPSCGPCNTLAPELEKFHRDHPELEVVMISKGDPKENRAKVREHGLTFPIVLQQHWEISRRYAMFATPVGYLIGENGIIAYDAALGFEPILNLASTAVHAPGLNEGLVSR
jgi:peroxiredoxin